MDIQNYHFTEIKKDVIDIYRDIENLKKDMSYGFYQPQFDIDEFLNSLENRSDNRVFLDILRKFDIKYFEETWQKHDWVIVFIAGSIGILLDALITQTNVLKPIDKAISEFMKTSRINNLKEFLDNISKFFRNGESAPIDFQNFEMLGLKSIHEQYSFGHDPLRFIEGIIQMMTGKYKGVDKFGNIITAGFGQGTPDFIQATVSYIAHMLSDFCNQLSLPYPGTTFLMQFGSEKIRNEIATAYRSQLFNARTFVYQGLPSFFINLIIRGYSVYDYYLQMHQMNLLISNSKLKYQEMLLAASAMITTSNLSINYVRAIILEEPHMIFKVNFPQITDTVKRAIKYLFSMHKSVADSTKDIAEMMKSVIDNPITPKSVECYVADIEKEYQGFK
jgi:hypothetical protein